MTHAAANWAPPTAEQIGLLGTHWSKGWIIEDNRISHSRCVGITLGKYGDQYDNTYQHNSQAYIYRAIQGIWLDWMSQGTVVSGNLLHDNLQQDLFVEVNHGPIIVVNNLFLSQVSVFEASSGGAYAHNLFAGQIKQRKETRQTPVFRNHSLDFVRLAGIHNGDERFYNNLFVAHGLDGYDNREPIWMQGNVLAAGGKASVHETNPLVAEEHDAKLALREASDGWYLDLALDTTWGEVVNRPLVTSDLLGKALTTDCPFENPDGTPLRIDTDYTGRIRHTDNPFPGPFEICDSGTRSIRVWPRP
jgi:alpha-N-arabinofuranosidase